MSIVNIQSPFDAFKATLEATGHPPQQRPGTITDAAGRACTKWIGPCPHHGGRSRNSLAVVEHVDGHFWAYCHGGCAPEQILSTVGLTPRDCWPAALRGGWDDATFELLIKAEIAAGSPWPVLREEAMIGPPATSCGPWSPTPRPIPAGLLVQFLVLFGVMVDRRPHLVLDGGRHGLNEFVALVGETSKGRKGTAWSHVEAAFGLGQVQMVRETGQGRGRPAERYFFAGQDDELVAGGYLDLAISSLSSRGSAESGSEAGAQFTLYEKEAKKI